MITSRTHLKETGYAKAEPAQSPKKAATSSSRSSSKLRRRSGKTKTTKRK